MDGRRVAEQFRHHDGVRYARRGRRLPRASMALEPFREVQCGVAPLVHRSREPRVVDGGDGEVLLVSGRAAGRFELVSSPTAARMHVGGSEYAGVYQSEMTYTLAVGP